MTGGPELALEVRRRTVIDVVAAGEVAGVVKRRPDVDGVTDRLE